MKRENDYWHTVVFIVAALCCSPQVQQPLIDWWNKPPAVVAAETAPASTGRTRRGFGRRVILFKHGFRATSVDGSR